jgi:hypothetical protein
MNQLAQAALVAAVRGRPRERRFDAAAQTASGLVRSATNSVWRKQPLAAYDADSALDRGHGIKAFLADGETRNLYQRGSTDTAIRGK